MLVARFFTTTSIDQLRHISPQAIAQHLGLNTGAKAKIQTYTMTLDENGNYSCDFTYGNSPTRYQLQITANGQIKMTDLLNDSTSGSFTASTRELFGTAGFPGIKSIQEQATALATQQLPTLLSSASSSASSDRSSDSSA